MKDLRKGVERKKKKEVMEGEVKNLMEEDIENRIKGGGEMIEDIDW